MNILTILESWSHSISCQISRLNSQIWSQVYTKSEILILPYIDISLQCMIPSEEHIIKSNDTRNVAHNNCTCAICSQ